jgi:hypothetical protein
VEPVQVQKPPTNLQEARYQGAQHNGTSLIEHREEIIQEKLKEMQQQAPYLRVCYLQQRHRAALAKRDVDKAKALLETTKKEKNIKHCRRL